MSIPCKFERSILSYDEHEIILRSHHPEIYDAALDDLKALRQRLREMRDKERTLARENRRAAQFPTRPPTGDTPSEGMRALPNRRRRTRVPPARIGSVSQATKNAQAGRDARNSSVR